MADAVANLLAERRLESISAKYNNYASLAKSADGYVRHKCFLSYHHDDAVEVEKFVETFESVFIPKVIGVTDYGDIINSENDDYIMDTIREKYLTDSTVTIVFIGKCTHSRKYIDWEILSSIRNDSKNRRSGVMAIELPSVHVNGASLPSRLSMNTGKVGTETYSRYWIYPSTASSLRTDIQDAFDARTSRSRWIKLGGPKQSYNTPC